VRTLLTLGNVAVTAIPAQNRVTLQILSMWQPFKDLKQTFAVSRRVKQLRLRAQQRVVATVEHSVLRTEMENLESEEEDAPRRVLWYKSMSWLGQMRPHRRTFALAADSARPIASSVADSTVASSPSPPPSPLDMTFPCST
jgi:hypothetical protein